MSLTPPTGYVLTVAQISENKPRGTIDCMVCPWMALLDVRVDGTEHDTGALIHRGIHSWHGHPCPSPIPDAATGMPDTSGVTG